MIKVSEVSSIPILILLTDLCRMGHGVKMAR